MQAALGLRLNLGCGSDILPGYVNHDARRHRPEVDIVHDLRLLPWPWQSDSAAEIRLLDVVEHLPEVVPVLDECWRVLEPGGILHLRVPHYQHENAWLDPTHRRAFHRDSFDYFDPDTALGNKYGFYTEHKWHIVHKEVNRDGNIVVDLRPRKDVRLDPHGWRAYTPVERLNLASEELAQAIAPGEPLILVPWDQWVPEQVAPGRRVIPFLERDGQYWGPPADDDVAIRELERLRAGGAQFMAFFWPAFWWLDYYAGLHQWLGTKCQRVLENNRLVIFDLR
jgi:hypothetical protein